MFKTKVKTLADLINERKDLKKDAYIFAEELSNTFSDAFN
jgi:hypothetical protein